MFKYVNGFGEERTVPVLAMFNHNDVTWVVVPNRRGEPHAVPLSHGELIALS